MKHWQKLGSGVTLVLVLVASHPTAAQAGWVYETIQIYRAWQDGRLLEELGWFAVRKVGEKLLEDTPAPEAASPESTPAEPPTSLPPLTFDLDGTMYLLAREDAITLKEGSTYLLPYCSLDADTRLFVFPNVTSCPYGSTPQESDYFISRIGNTISAERQS